MARQTFVALRGYETALDTNKLSFLYFVGTGEETPPGMQLDLVTPPPQPSSHLAYSSCGARRMASALRSLIKP